MILRGYGRIAAAAVAGWVVLATGCGKSSPASSAAGNRGVTGTSYLVTVFRPTGGTVVSTPPGINCGTGGTACGPVSFPWAQDVSLQATPDAGNMLGSWNGDCTGIANPCVLSTTPSGADKYVVPVFGQSGRTQHPNFSDPDLHGPAYIAWATSWNTGRTDVYECTYCHGATYNGMGIAPSCNACHAKQLGVTPAPTTPDFWQNNCTFCHGAPPPPAPAGYPQNICDPVNPAPGCVPHPPSRVTGDPAASPPLCSSCHGTTVNQAGEIVPRSQGGTHLNGHIDGGGHQDGFNAPALHGREFFDAIARNPGAPYCQMCHGTNYEVLVLANSAGGQGRSCNTCHQAAGWLGTTNPLVAGSGWQSNCSFCHGKEAVQPDGNPQAGAYDAAAHPLWAAPPDTIGQRVGVPEAPERAGAHTGHLSSAIAPTACASCHSVPTLQAALTHPTGRDNRATVIVTAPAKPPNPNAYDPATQTCATYCHDPLNYVPATGAVANRSPAWPTATIACAGCHPVPPATSAHSGLPTISVPPTNADFVVCSGCHPNTISPDGSFNTVAGGHVNGVLDVVSGHAAGFYLPANHGMQYLRTLAGAQGALACASCHSQYGNCNGCHANPAAQASPDRPELASYTTQWVNWRSNCTFCHGTKTADFTGQPLYLGGPPDSITQRFDGVPVPAREGWHSQHLLDGQFAPAPNYNCSGCHAVPTTIDQAGHVTWDNTAQAVGRATVTLDASVFPGLSAADIAKLPSPLGTYDPATGNCTVYCHAPTTAADVGGSPRVTVFWTNDYLAPNYSPLYNCTDCHGSPPASGATVVGHTYPLPAPTNTIYCGASGCSNHQYHRNAQNANQYDSCANCHYGSASGTFYNGLHANGRKDVVPSGTNVGAKPVTFTWTPATPPATGGTCSNVSCHTKSGSGAQTW